MGENARRGIRRNVPALAGIGLVLAAAFLFLFIAAGEGNGGEQDAVKRQSPAGLRKIRIALDDYPNAGHAFLFAAEEKGFLREQGFVLEPVVAGPGRHPLRMLAEGRADLALASQPDVLLARNEGLGVVSVAAIVRQPLVYLMVPEDSPIRTPAHLEGRTVVLSGLPVHEAVLATMLDSVPGGRPDVTAVAADGPYADMLLGGEADALLGADILEGKDRLEKAGIRLRIIEPMLYGVPRYYETVLAAGEGPLADDRETFERVWTALARGHDYVEKDPAAAARMLSDAGVFDGNPAWTVSLEHLERRLPFMREGTAPFGSQDKETWKETEKWLSGMGRIGASVRAEDAFVDLAAEAAEGGR